MAAYGAAKSRLFDAPDLQHIVVNVGDAFGREFAQNYAGRVPLTAIWIGAGDSGWLAERALRATQVTLDLHGISMQLDGSFGKAAVATRLLGRFNAENSLVVIACLLALGASLAEAARVLAECVAPPGRMEVVESAARDKPMAVVDYAHTPDALAKALSALREHCQGALWCVFGCGGDRDPGHYPRHHQRHQIAHRTGHSRPRRSHRHGAQGSSIEGYRADRGQGPRGLPDLWRDAAHFQRSTRSAALSRGGRMSPGLTA